MKYFIHFVTDVKSENPNAVNNKLCTSIHQSYVEGDSGPVEGSQAVRREGVCGRLERVFVYTRYRGKKPLRANGNGRDDRSGGDRTISKSAFLNDTEEEVEGEERGHKNGAREVRGPRYTMDGKRFRCFVAPPTHSLTRPLMQRRS